MHLIHSLFWDVMRDVALSPLVVLPSSPSMFVSWVISRPSISRIVSRTFAMPNRRPFRRHRHPRDEPHTQAIKKSPSHKSVSARATAESGSKNTPPSGVPVSGKPHAQHRLNVWCIRYYVWPRPRLSYVAPTVQIQSAQSHGCSLSCPKNKPPNSPETAE